MRVPLPFVLSVLSVLSLFAAEPQTIETLSGQRYEKAIVTRQDPESITVTHATGVARIPFADLSPELRKQFGYDPAKLIVAKRQQEAARKQADLNNQVASAEQRELAKRRAAKLKELRLWAQQNLAMADREGQLKAVLATKMAHDRGHPFSMEEFQFLDQDTRICIILYAPDALPVALLDQ